MFGDMIVPLDGSEHSAVALGPAGALAHFLNTRVRVAAFVQAGDEDEMLEWIGTQLRMLGDVEREVTVSRASGSVATQLHDMVSDSPSDLICMSTHGRGRSAAMFGSVASDVLRASSAPVMLIGPHYRAHQFRATGKMLVAVDGSDHGETALPVAEAYAIVFGNDVNVVTVIDSKASAAMHAAGGASSGAIVESNYVRNIADKMSSEVGRPVTYEVLHGDHAAESLVDYADSLDCSVVVMATHGVTGLRRAVSGSVVADVVRTAPMPILAIRPAQLSS
jgi:nucleotide-binding universal stress UspA family protein